MTTKSGQLQFKDIRQGKAAWVVEVIERKGKTYARPPKRVALLGLPYLIGGSWFVRYFAQKVTYVSQCRGYSIETPNLEIKNNKITHRSGIFKSHKAAENYIKRISAEKVSAIQFDAVNQALIDDFYETLHAKRCAGYGAATSGAV